MKTKLLIILLFTVTSALALAETFEISIKNTSRRDGFGGQNISRPALIIHQKSFALFKAGQPASQVLWEIAEDGDTGLALALQGQHPGIVSTHRLKRLRRDQVEPAVEQFSVGDSQGLAFSLAGMMTASNDAFAGVNSHDLPKNTGDKLFFTVRAWDAGSEINNEICPFVPSDEHYIRKTEGSEGMVQPHRGIKGGGVLDIIDHGWPSDNVVAEGSITRIN